MAKNDSKWTLTVWFKVGVKLGVNDEISQEVTMSPNRSKALAWVIFHLKWPKTIENRPNAKVTVMKCRYTISLTCVLKTKDRLDDHIVLCMIVRLIVYSAYHYSPFAFGLWMVTVWCNVGANVRVRVRVKFGLSQEVRVSRCR
jgi:hypothetical protein